jgi:hypothetical protein
MKETILQMLYVYGDNYARQTEIDTAQRLVGLHIKLYSASFLYFLI